MKHFILILSTSILALYSFSQTSVSQNNVLSKKSENREWNLNKYVWSHTHSRANKNDKPLIDFDAIDNWGGLLAENDVSISPNGAYFAYATKNNVTRELDSLVVQSVTNTWRQAMVGARPGVFSRDNRQYIFQDKEGLCFLELGSSERRYIRDVVSYQLPGNGSNEWLACQLKGNDLLLQNLISGKEKRFTDVLAYSFDKSNEWLAIQVNQSQDLIIYNLKTGEQQSFPSVKSYVFSSKGTSMLYNGNRGLQYVNLTNEKAMGIWSTADSTVMLGNFSMDDTGNQVVFMVQQAGQNSIWYWRQGMPEAVMKLSNQSPKIDGKLLIVEPASFSDNGRYIRFSLLPEPDGRKPKPDNVQVDVWSYQDNIIQATQPSLQIKPTEAILSVENEKLIQLQDFEYIAKMTGNYAIVCKSGKEMNGDRFWRKDYYLDSQWVISLRSGSRKYLVRGNYQDDLIQISPGGNYLVYFDADKKGHYISYDLRTSKLVDISSGVYDWKFLFIPSLTKTNVTFPNPVGISGWLEDDKGILVYDNYDIWQLDLAGGKKPVNITNGLGQSNQMLFSLLHSDRISFSNNLVVAIKDTLLLRAFNRQNKYNGFYRKVLGKAGNPEMLYLGPCFFEQLINTSGDVDKGMHPLKATDANVWIVKRQTATEAPNYFVTKDFKNFKQLTHRQPHVEFNWLTAELHDFKRLDGTVGQGVLYKPENFDSTKKYPVIISFYMHSSDQLYQYPNPIYINAPTIFENPAWLASHGYLVFAPDILFTPKQWGPSTINTVDGVARYLSQLPYVDGNHMGACGHSNSGRLGYYLLTHSHSFAAMCWGSGFTGTDFISLALSLEYPSGQKSNLETAERTAITSGLGNLWQNKATWIDHTAVLQADKATAPLLLFHNKPDGDDWRAAVELYTAFRRLEKKAWWLQYDEGHHTLWAGTKDEKDFTIRFTQFFDHYLKGVPAPRWMTEGIPYKLKGIESRFELDPGGTCALPGKNECLICKKWNEQYKNNPEMFTKEVSEWHFKSASIKTNISTTTSTKPKQ